MFTILGQRRIEMILKADWKAILKATGQEYSRICQELLGFESEHPEWGWEIWIPNYPPKIVMVFHLRSDSSDPRRMTISNPTRIAVLKDEEMAVPVDFVAAVAGRMTPRRVRSDPGLLDYELRVNYDDYPRRARVV